MDDIERVYAEVDRRIDIDTKEGGFCSIDEIEEYRRAMVQGVYGTLMVLSSNWPDVRCSMIDKIEEMRWNK